MQSLVRRFVFVLLASCVLLVVSCTGYNHTSIPNVPYVNLDIHKQSHLMTSSDRACVFNGGDMITNTGVRYKNSGRFMHEIFVVTMQQYNLESAVDMSQVDAMGVEPMQLQDQARSNYCNIITIVRPVFWQDSQISPGNVGVNVDMYDTSSLELLNSVTLNARSTYIQDMFEDGSPMRPVIEAYVDQLHR